MKHIIALALLIFALIGQFALAQVLRPIADFEPVTTYIMTESFNDHFGDEFDGMRVKAELAKALPESVKLVILTRKEAVESTHWFFSQYISTNRLVVLPFDGKTNGGFWMRDSAPYPVLLDNNGKAELGLVDAPYIPYTTTDRFEPDQLIADHLKISKVIPQPTPMAGGNLIADTQGNCFIINSSKVANHPDSLYLVSYGCKTLTRFPKVPGDGPEGRGIGHVDERVRFINDTLALTDEPVYKVILERMGYEVRMLPTPTGTFRTYVNAIILNDTVIVPIFNADTDADAVKVYESTGLKVKTIQTVQLSDVGWGSLHCMGYAYPTN